MGVPGVGERRQLCGRRQLCSRRQLRNRGIACRPQRRQCTSSSTATKAGVRGQARSTAGGSQPAAAYARAASLAAAATLPAPHSAMAAVGRPPKPKDAQFSAAVNAVGREMPRRPCFAPAATHTTAARPPGRASGPLVSYHPGPDRAAAAWRATRTARGRAGAPELGLLAAAPAGAALPICWICACSTRYTRPCANTLTCTTPHRARR